MTLFHCNRGLRILPHYNVSNIKTGRDTVKSRGLSSLMSTLANVSHKGQHTGTQRVLLRQNKATQWPTIGTSPSVILTSPFLKIPLCFSSSLPSLTVAKFSICSLNKCLWSCKDGNQPALSRIWFGPCPYCLSTSIPQMVAWLLQGTLPLCGFAASPLVFCFFLGGGC